MEPGSRTVLTTLKLLLIKVWDLVCYILISIPFRIRWTISRSEYYSYRIEEMIKKEKTRPGMNKVDAEIEASEVHWTRTSKLVQANEQESCTLARQCDAEANEQLFESHLKKPWGRFFMKMDDSTRIGDKPIAIGGQAVIFLEEQVSGEPRSYMGRTRHVLKVFKHQRSLQKVLEQGVPKGMLGEHVLTRQRLHELVETPEGTTEQHVVFTTGRPSTQRRLHRCNVSHIVLLKDGRLAFRIAQYSTDLRKFIDDRLIMQANEGPPFTDDVATLCMLQIAMGMQDLHNEDIVHCDLKASNVLISNSLFGIEPDRKDLRDYPLYCWLADFECSVGCLGTEFWNAPEILHFLEGGENCEEEDSEEEDGEEADGEEADGEEADGEEADGEEADGEEEAPDEEDGEERDPDEDDLKYLEERDLKDKDLDLLTGLFTKKSDVYSYAMTCYEIVTGLVPFERGQHEQKVDKHDIFCPPYKRPKIPSDIKPWIKELLEKCWHHEPLERPSFEEIVSIIETREPSSKARNLRLLTQVH